MHDIDTAIFVFAAVVALVLLTGLGTLAYLAWMLVSWMVGGVL